MRSRISARSNCAIAPNTWNTSTPPGVVVLMLSASDTSPMPPSSRSSAVVISFFSERASRSSFHTTSTSPLDACQCRPVRLGAGRLLGMDLLAAGTPERVELQLGRLVGGADSGVPDPHPTSLFSKPIRLVAFRNRAIKGGYEKGKCLDARPRAARARDRQKRSFGRMPHRNHTPNPIGVFGHHQAAAKVEDSSESRGSEFMPPLPWRSWWPAPTNSDRPAPPWRRVEDPTRSPRLACYHPSGTPP